MSGDPERDGSKARPTAPAGVLGGSGKRPESAPVETGGRAPKSAFAHTIAMPGATPAPPSEPDKLSVPRSNSDAAEPLREPSERPAPTPYKRERAMGGTLPMPELNKPIGARSEERMIAAKQGARAESGSVEVHGAAKVGTREAIVQMPTTAAGAASSKRPAAHQASPLPPAPPPSGAPPAMRTAKSPVPAAPQRDEHSVPRLSLGVEKIPSGKPAAAAKVDVGQSLPLQLSLKPSDHVESSLRPEAQATQRSMLPWIALAVILILGGVAFAMMGGGDEPAPVAQDRVEAVPAVEPGAAATPTPATEPPQAATPTAPVAPPPVVKPEAPAAAPLQEVKKPAQPAKKVEAPAKPSTKSKASTSKKPVLKVSPEGEGDLEKALRAAERMAEPTGEDLAPQPRSGEPPSPD